MTKLYAGLAAVVLATMIGGTAVWTLLREDHVCAGNAVAGGPGSIGGPFELLDGEGRLVTDKDVITKPTLVYFGYTFCPDVCPFDVARNVLAVDILAEQGVEVTPLFITIDPERDTPEIVAQYAVDMHPDMIALTGSAEQVKAASQAYRAFYSKGSGEGEFYLMSHSTFTYLTFPGDVGITTYFAREASPEEMASEVACHVGNR
ncbi:MAG: SCO family protein [Boseongicola sp.]|nr:SCO family protein [Boseongicola sp.]MDD9979369.1 SCO family protein [Boseongicola sp.]